MNFENHVKISHTWFCFVWTRKAFFFKKKSVRIIIDFKFEIISSELLPEPRAYWKQPLSKVVYASPFLDSINGIYIIILLLIVKNNHLIR